MLNAGVQDASHPRAGPSPPGFSETSRGSHEPPYARRKRTTGASQRRLVMPARELPVRPDLDQLKHQAKDLLRALHDGEPSAVSDLARYHGEPIEPSRAKLTDAQLVLARGYGAPSWPRIVLSCQLIDAIWRDDVDAVRSLVLKTPKLLHENALIEGRNWGPPMSYAANLGRDAIIRMLHGLGATDHLSAIGRATLQGQVSTARMLYAMLDSPRLPNDPLGGPAYTLNVGGTAFVY